MDTAGKMSISIRCAIGEWGLKNLVSSFQTRSQKDPFSLNRFPPPLKPRTGNLRGHVCGGNDSRYAEWIRLQKRPLT